MCYFDCVTFQFLFYRFGLFDLPLEPVLFDASIPTGPSVALTSSTAPTQSTPLAGPQNVVELPVAPPPAGANSALPMPPGMATVLGIMDQIPMPIMPGNAPTTSGTSSGPTAVTLRDEAQPTTMAG